jgi:diazepam-binding inhibitor (GABA receptor modulating acyl-CoA-binding protein)
MDSYPLAKHFDDCSQKIKTDGKNVSNDDLQVIYGLYKQATEGDNTKEEPSFYQLTEKAKWKAWNANKGKSKEQAKHEYVDYCKKFLPDNIKNNYQ